MNEIKYEVKVTRGEERLFSCILTCKDYGPNHIPYEALNAIAGPLAPCDVTCHCLSGGWFAERHFS